MVGERFELSLHTGKEVLPPFLFSSRISFGQSQALQTLTKFIYKNIKIYNNKSTTKILRYTITDHIQICSSKSRDLEKTYVLPTNMDASLDQHSVQTERQICL